MITAVDIVGGLQVDQWFKIAALFTMALAVGWLRRGRAREEREINE